MGKDDNFIVAIELGSSKVTGIAGRKQPDGAIQILAFVQEPSTTFIRKGRINNVSKATQSIAGIKERLEHLTKKHIVRAYVGIGGFGMHTVSNSVLHPFESKVEVTQEMVDLMNNENRASVAPGYDILEAVPQEYRLGTQTQADPVGIRTESLEGRYLNIVTSSSVSEEINDCFKNAGLRIAGKPITMLTLADAMLTEPERRSGCVFVDMGAETTSVAVFKNNLLRHLAVIPLGGANVNRDIMSLQVEEEEAEALKIKYGTACPSEDVGAQPPIELSDGRKIPYADFIGLVEARLEEIVLNVNNQISLSPYDRSQLIGGLILTGGVANTRDIENLVAQVTKFDKIRFVRGLRTTLRAADYPDLNRDGSCNVAIALIENGDMNCCGGDLTDNGNILIKEPETDAGGEETAEKKSDKTDKAPAQPSAPPASAEEKDTSTKVKKGWVRVKNFLTNLVKEPDEN